MKKQRARKVQRATTPKPQTFQNQAPVTEEAAPEVETSDLVLSFANPQALTTNNIMRMQSTLGNRAVQRFINQARQARIPAIPVQRHTNYHYAQESVPAVQRLPMWHTCSAACKHAPVAKSIARMNLVQRNSDGTHTCTSACSHDRVERSLAPAKGVIQRHSSFEHKMLGDVSPEVLQIISSAENLDSFSGGGKAKQNGVNLKINDSIYGTQTINQQHVLHALDQEINRIKFFRDQPHQPGEGREAFEKRLKKLDIKANPPPTDTGKSAALEQAWQVRILELPSTGGKPPLMITYGEMNTLADFYGSTKELRGADPVNRYRIMQGIRQQSLLKFMDLRDKVAGVSSTKIATNARFGEGFDNAIGTTGRGAAFGPLKGGAFGEVRLMGTFDTGTFLTPQSMQGKREVGGKAQDYTSGLARNACHFAPESWYSWGDYHTKARDLALKAYTAKQNANQLSFENAKEDSPKKIEENKKQIVVEKATADEAENNALIENGFGDHFLQDSYAAGHLINKTEIMKEMTRWLDTQPWKSDTETATNWRQIQAIAYGQKGIGLEDDRYNTKKVGTTHAKDPQSVENIEDDSGKGVDWKTRFDRLGLEVPASVTPGSTYFDFMVRWQARAMQWYNSRKWTVAKAKEALPTNSIPFIRDAFKQLVDDNVARVNWAGIKRAKTAQMTEKDVKDHSFLLREEYVPSKKKEFEAFLKTYYSGKTDPTSLKAKKEAATGYERSAAAITYQQYHYFLNNIMLQAATNILHDFYCKHGVKVQTGKGDALGRIYGDDAMLGKDSSIGVKYSAETANMSRKAIEEIAAKGVSTTAPALTAISERFPTHVVLDTKGGESIVGLAAWHKGALRDHCIKGLEATVTERGHKAIYEKTHGSIKGKLGNLKELSKQVSKDATSNVHSGELF